RFIMGGAIAACAASGPCLVGAVVVGGVALAVNAAADKKPDEVKPTEEVKPDSTKKPDGLPTGTKDVDKDKRLKGGNKIHDIKDEIGAGPQDWTGISPDGHIWTNVEGAPYDWGHYSDLIPGNAGPGNGRPGK
ncbi:hypothetical protein, partial [Rhodoferax sp.]|uniref:hypothetical protein n=1 Tax=Rhodoferax sp. TaxID=50421 RepID=UPI00275026BE|nr:hypothetical protein [Rhodoferax sp.]